MRRILVRLAPLGVLVALWPISALAGWFLTTQAPLTMPEPGSGALILSGVLGMLAVMRRRIFGT